MTNITIESLSLEAKQIIEGAIEHAKALIGERAQALPEVQQLKAAIPEFTMIQVSFGWSGWNDGDQEYPIEVDLLEAIIDEDLRLDDVNSAGELSVRSNDYTFNFTPDPAIFKLADDGDSALLEAYGSVSNMLFELFSGYMETGSVLSVKV